MGLLDGIMGNASRVDPAAAHKESGRLLAQEEQIHAAYQLVRDSFLFTDRRLILVDKQGMTGRKVEYHTIGVPQHHASSARAWTSTRSRRCSPRSCRADQRE